MFGCNLLQNKPSKCVATRCYLSPTNQRQTRGFVDDNKEDDVQDYISVLDLKVQDQVLFLIAKSRAVVVQPDGAKL